ncbi:DUF4082 domain-containing protein [Fischerella sp. PCC 9605]|uniref:DUF4082 domain-containing protein n=1 Tax=Fischerella sp. PCC 9605 TaxID=1173024 RepID=UPI0004BBF549|nr:DUF4082 domain-containing protein [Fischerella sp. PCC 9605]
MRRFLKYISIFCCSLLLVFFLDQIVSYTVAQDTSKNPNRVGAIAFSSDGSSLASGVEDGRVVVFDVATGTVSKTLSSEEEDLPVTGVVFNPKDKNKVASVARDSVVRVWDVGAGKETKILRGHENPTRAIATNPDGSILASGGEDSRIALWDEKSSKLLRLLEGHLDFVNSLAFGSNGRTLVSGSKDQRIIIWDVTTGRQIQTLLGHSDEVTGVAISPDEKLIASASADGSVRLWDADKGMQLQILRGPTKRVRTVAFSTDGKILAGAGDDNKVFLWEVPSGRPRGSLQGNKKLITALAFNPTDPNTLASAGIEGDVIVFDLAKGQQKKALNLPAKQKSEQPGKQKSLKIEKPNASVKEDTISPVDRTLIASIPSPPGGPILVVTSSSNRFGEYYAEILRNEGLNYFNVSDISSVSAATLGNYDVIILAEMALTPNQVTMFSDWVNGGGNLIAMRPDKQLASLLGLADAGSTLSNAYLLIDTSKASGNGLVNQTIQFHGTADRYNLNGASSLANLYTNATTATTNPAVTLRSIGSNGGHAAAFTYDLARSIVYTRQGNPAWAGQERDGFSPIRSDDLYFGNASFDPQSDWVDLNKVAIPQADEQQRLLANLIIEINKAKKPLPRFWYFPRGKKAVVLMTGDDHANGGTIGRFDQFKAQSPAGCSVDNWECIRGTSYVYTGVPFNDATAATYNADGFEISLHLDTGCRNFTPSSLESLYTQQLNNFSTKFPSLPAPATQRQHCLVWSDWSTTPEVEVSKGMRLNTTYYYWPPSWVQNRPGFFTGSGMPMRLAKQDGSVIDVYEANTQLTDESGQSYPYNIDTLLDKALGSEGYYGVFDVNAHTDGVNSSVSDAVVNSAKTRSVPVISARQLLTWLDGRNTSSFDSLSWSNNTLNFSINKGTGANGLQAMLPTRSANGILDINSIRRDGSSVTATITAIKGVEYAIFSGDAGSYVATYIPDTTAPTVSSTSPANAATNVSVGTSITAIFDEAIDPTTINSNTFELRDPSNVLVAATITYDAGTRTAMLKPNAILTANTTYTATLKGGTTDPRVKDLVGNSLAGNFTWSFTTAAVPCSQQECTIWSSSTTPANPSASDPNAVELGVKFRSDLNGYITGIRFYKGSTNTGTHTGTLWSSSGQKLATATFTNETASGWQQVNFANPVPITANTVYVASYYAPNGRYALNNNYFASSGVDNEPLHALRNGVSGGNGVYKYGTSGFPTSSYQSTNYWVDVAFTTVTGSDITPPTVASTTPTNSATGVNISTTVKATFSEAMDAATISTSNFELRDPNNTLVTGTVTYDAASNTATLTPSSTLAISTTYTATIKGGTTGVKDQAGNALAQNYTWSFTTTNTSSVSIWDDSATPALITENDSSAVNLGVKFRSDVNGNITGIRFYKGPQNTGTHVGVLWTSSGQELARATFTNETASGWQQVNFATPVAITANTVYVASYHTTVGRYSQDVGYFANSGVDKPPLHALRNGESGPNGVYTYSATPAFPTSTYQSTNYWVDVVFNTTN